MAALMPSGTGVNQSANPYEQYDAPVEDDLIDPDDGTLPVHPPKSPTRPANTYSATLDELEDPAHSSDRAPLTGRITNQQAQANARSAGSAQGYLTSAISGEDRRAPMNTIDESVWDTLRRDLLAVWEKMRQVLYPKYLLGGMMRRDAQGEAEAEGVAGALGHVRGLVGRLPDADLVLQGGMSEGLRDWDLWYVVISTRFGGKLLTEISTGVRYCSVYSSLSSSA